MHESVYELALDTVRFHSAGYRDAAAGHRHITRPSLFLGEIIAVEQGVLSLAIDRRRHHAGAGTVLYCPPGARQEGFAPSPERVRYLWMHFDARRKRVEQLGARECVAKAVGSDRLTHAYVEDICRPARFGDILELGHLVAAPEPWVEPEKSALMVALLCRLTRMQFCEQSVPVTSAQRLAVDIRNYVQGMLINPRLSRDVCVRHLAMRFNRNAGYLNRRFREVCGTSLANEIARLRVEEAKRRLGQGSTVKQAAELCGYANARYMARMFRRFAGMSASQVRALKQSP